MEEKPLVYHYSGTKSADQEMKESEEDKSKATALGGE